MSILMKALRTFNGQAGEGVRQGDGSWFVDAGSEINVGNEHRAADLERRELAVPMKAAAKAEPPPKNKMENAPKNKAASQGPLASRGGRTGESRSRSSSARGHQPRARSSSRSKAKRGS